MYFDACGRIWMHLNVFEWIWMHFDAFGCNNNLASYDDDNDKFTIYS